jgi:Zinc finger C-x8-C-x5-C-x3-H type (and similar)
LTNVFFPLYDLDCRPKKVSYYLAQALDPHSRIPPNAGGLHIQWCNLQLAVDKAAFRNMQEVFTHACTFVESRKKARQQARRKTGDSPRSNYGSNSPHSFSPSTAHSEADETTAVDVVASVKSQLKGLNITSLQDSPLPRPYGFGQTADDRGSGKPTHHAGDHRLSRELMPVDHQDKSGKSLSDNPLYKTRLCERFETEGYCPYEGKCTFAHGTTELRERMADAAVEDKPSAKTEFNDGNNLFKTRLCERYMKGMFCQYGPKCNFGKLLMQCRPVGPI